MKPKDILEHLESGTKERVFEMLRVKPLEMNYSIRSHFELLQGTQMQYRGLQGGLQNVYGINGNF